MSLVDNSTEPRKTKRRITGYSRGPIAKGARAPVIDGSERAVTERVKALVHAMVVEGKRVQQAAEIAGLSVSAAYQALMKPAVIKHLNEQVEVFRRGARASNVAVALDIRDTDASGKTRLEAAKYLDGLENQAAKVQVNIGIGISPGYTVIGATAAQQMLQLAGSSASVLDYQEDSEERSDMQASERVIEGQAIDESGDT